MERLADELVDCKMADSETGGLQVTDRLTNRQLGGSDERTDGRTDGWTDGRTDGRMDG